METILNDLCDLEKKVKVMKFKLGIRQALLLLWIHQIFLEILSRNHHSYVVALNDLCDLENEVKVTRLEGCLRLALVLLYTKFGEDTTNVSSNIERKPSFIICHRLK